MCVIDFEQTHDYELVKRIVTNQKVYRNLTDDESPLPEDWEPSRDDFHHYIIVKADGKPSGLFMLTPQNSVCVEIHTCLLPCIWGATALEAAKMMAKWIWANSTWERIVTNVPDYNRLALHFAKHAGMKVFGVNPRSFKKYGQLHDQIMLGISKCH